MPRFMRKSGKKGKEKNWTKAHPWGLTGYPCAQSEHSIFLFYYFCWCCVLEWSPFEFGHLLFATAINALVIWRYFFAIWLVCFDIREHDRMASQTVDTLYLSQLWRFSFFLQPFLMTSYFFAIKNTYQCSFCFRASFYGFLFYIWTWFFASFF